MNWYIKNRNEQLGPYTLGELKTLSQKAEFNRDTLVWVYQKESWDWIRAEEVIELSELFWLKGPEERLGLSTPLKMSHEEDPSKSLAKAESKNLLDDKIWAVAGGKGGVGKSVIASSLAIGLTFLGKKVVLVDLDLGGANLHTLLGTREPSKTIYDFWMGEVHSLEDVVVRTEIPNLSFISGKTGVLGSANIDTAAKEKVISCLKTLECDYVILDIGAGTHYDQLDFFNAADENIVVAVPEPHAIQDGFYFIKTALLRKIFLEFNQNPSVEEYFREKKHINLEKIESFLLDIQAKDPAIHELIQSSLISFCPRIILNQVMDRNEVKDGYFILKSLKDILGIQSDLLGYVYFDPEIRKATQNLKPFLLYSPKSKAATCIFSIIVHRILNQRYLKAKLEERNLQKKVEKTDYETTYQGYRSGIGIYK